MKHNTEIICDDNGFEILVGYDHDLTPAYYEEPNNPGTYVEEMVYTELKTVEVIFCGKGIDILPVLNEAQKEAIIRKLSYES